MKKYTITEAQIREIIQHLKPIILAESVQAARPGVPSDWKVLYFDPTPGLIDKYIVIHNTKEIIRTALLQQAVEAYNEL